MIASRDLANSGSYTIGAVFAGSHGFVGSVASAAMTVLDAAIQIRTVPALPNVAFVLGALNAVTGPDGVAALPVPQSGPYQLSTDLNPDNAADPTVKASFQRWVDGVSTPNRTIQVEGPATYTAVLRLAYRATIKYVDQSDQPVDPTIVDEAQFSSSAGGGDVVVNSQTGADNVWWTAAVTSQTGQAATATPVVYRVMSVKVHGAETVKSGEQSWTPTEGGVWIIKLTLFSISVQARDSLFGGPLSGQVRLTYPDGSYIDQPISDGVATFDGLPAGVYKVETSAGFLPVYGTISLSRPEVDTLTAVTFTDLGLGAGLFLAVLGLLALAVRTRVVRRRVGRRDPAGMIPSSS